MKVIDLKEEKINITAEVDRLGGTLIDEESYDLLISGEDTKVLKPNGDVLLILRTKVIPQELYDAAYPELNQAARTSFNRGYAGGDVEELPEDDPRRNYLLGGLVAGKKSKGKRVLPLRSDGKISKTQYAKPVDSGIIGYYDRNPRNPYCRQTSYNIDHHKEFHTNILPLIRRCDEIFKEEMPKRYQAQMDYVKETAPDFIINDTAFTTVTVNKNWRTEVHKDEGDLKEGFGVMTAMWAYTNPDTNRKEVQLGRSKRCYLIFPKYRVAVNMTAGDVLLADVHEWHGNGRKTNIEGECDRISLVMYYREGMKECGTGEEETRRALEGASNRDLSGVKRSMKGKEADSEEGRLF